MKRPLIIDSCFEPGIIQISPFLAALSSLMDFLRGSFVVAQNQNALSLKIKAEAQRLGFELVGFSPVKLPPHEQSFAEWLRLGFSGEMEYMKRTADLRRRLTAQE